MKTLVAQHLDRAQRHFAAAARLSRPDPVVPSTAVISTAERQLHETLAQVEQNVLRSKSRILSAKKPRDAT